MAANKAALNRKIRQEALRDQLAAGGHLQYVVDIAKDLHEGALELTSSAIAAKKAAADIHLKLISKYLPDLKQVEIEGEIDSTLTIVRKEYKPST